MEAVIIMSIVIVPCWVFIIWYFSPWGKRWRRANGVA